MELGSAIIIVSFLVSMAIFGVYVYWIVFFLYKTIIYLVNRNKTEADSFEVLSVAFLNDIFLKVNARQVKNRCTVVKLYSFLIAMLSGLILSAIILIYRDFVLTLISFIVISALSGLLSTMIIKIKDKYISICQLGFNAKVCGFLIVLIPAFILSGMLIKSYLNPDCIGDECDPSSGITIIAIIIIMFGSYVLGIISSIIAAFSAWTEIKVFDIYKSIVSKRRDDIN